MQRLHEEFLAARLDLVPIGKGNQRDELPWHGFPRAHTHWGSLSLESRHEAAHPNAASRAGGIRPELRRESVASCVAVRCRASAEVERLTAHCQSLSQ